MNATLWITQVMLSAIMIPIGMMKTFLPVEKLKMLGWTTRRSKGFIRFVGMSEILIGLGLVLPGATRILPILTPFAATSLCLVMIFATIEHIQHKETNEIWKNVLIFLLAAFVAVGRSVLCI